MYMYAENIPILSRVIVIVFIAFTSDCAGMDISTSQAYGPVSDDGNVMLSLVPVPFSTTVPSELDQAIVGSCTRPATTSATHVRVNGSPSLVKAAVSTVTLGGGRSASGSTYVPSKSMSNTNRFRDS